MQERPIKHYATGIFDGPHATPRDSSEGPVFLGIKNITDDGRIDCSEIRHISEEDFARWTKRVVPRPGDIVFSYEATLHRYAIIPEGFRGCLGRRIALIRPDEAAVDGRYLLYYLLSPAWRRVIETSIISGATVDRIPLEKLPDFPVRLHALSAQHRIARTLSSYDDLIQNNLRRITLLEESARLLYEEWFVRLRFPGYEHTRIVDGVPEGWERNILSEISNYISRGIAPNYDDEAEGLVINQKCIRNGMLDVALARRQSREFPEVKQVQRGDVLINSTGEGTLGRVTQVKSMIPNCTVDSHVTIVRPEPRIPIHYFGMALTSLESRFSIMGRGATNQTELSRTTISETRVLLPSPLIAMEFENSAGPIYDLISNLAIQNRKLKQARDLLLPRLMSGEIEV